MRKEMLGGCTYDLGVYNTSLILRMMGEKPVRISAVSSFSEEGIDKLTSVIMEYADGKKANFICGMILETEKDRHIDRFEIQGRKGSIRRSRFEFNGDGQLSYILKFWDENGKEIEETKTVEVPQNYALEIT